MFHNNDNPTTGGLKLRRWRHRVGSTPTRPTEEKKTYSSCMIYCKSFLVEKEGLFFIELMIQLAYTGKERS
jgi:hypothetical protein